MGGCPCKTFTVNRGQEAGRKCIEPFIFSVSDAENVLMEADLGDYLLYRDYTTDRILLSVRYYSHIRHHRISQDNGLYFLNGQPYPYLDSIVLYHRQHRLDSLKLKKQAQLSARVVRLFAHKITSANGNNVYTLNNEIPPLPPSQQQQQQLQQHATTPTNNNNNNIVDDLNRINHLNNNNNQHQQDNHPYSYTNAVFQADDENEPETEVQVRHVTNNSNNNNNNNNNNANDDHDVNYVSQIDIQTSPTLPTHAPTTNHNLLLSSLHSNGAAIAIPATNHVTTATTPISTPNNNTTTTTTKTVFDDEIETETETELKSSDTPGNTTPTENALESPQPETFFHKFPQNNDVVKTETDANANSNKQHNKQTLIWTPSLNNDYIEASKRLIIAASPLKNSLFGVNKKPEVETTAKTTKTTSPYKNNNSISETKNNLILSPTSTKLNLKPNVTSLSKNSSFSGRPYLFLSQTPSHKKLTTGATNGIAKPPRRAHSFLSTSSSSSSKRKSDMMIAQDTDNNSIALSSWTPLPPINGAGSALSEFDDSTVGSHVSLISISTSSESKVIYSERL